MGRGKRYKRTFVTVRPVSKKRGGLPPGAVSIPPDQPIPARAFIPAEFLGDDIFYGGEEFDEEAEY